MSDMVCNDVSTKTKCKKVVPAPYTDFTDICNGNVTVICSGESRGVEMQRIDKDWKENVWEFCDQ